ncbi:MAG: hypothetical protein M0R40_04800 [Firmicutes bacterium]|nr:hypothetical protein [Bacillota bacterium]
MTVLYIIIVSIGIIGFLALIVYFDKVKCPKCGKRNCQEISRIKTESQEISISKKEKIKHYGKDQIIYGHVKPHHEYRPENVTIREYTVPGIRIFYNANYFCKVCGETFSVSVYEDKEK